ncbi:Sugar lactone lactonase YvrE [Salinimicrobium catena]|uniref:Sugar lactone lactonase YvrE n=1 Tax=Salinimicrobium catena TaxID=390640 RepID=A0A1H5LUC1_9FLAO|nr:hypothetical protein [Salinimicrobium catena]SDL14468.1 Sugar lactone lactonase YvrE [Salinimicrobium catena]SEE80570.1 Sugar lactone lactonase YvrE [Salinimicrobium catena]
MKYFVISLLLGLFIQANAQKTKKPYKQLQGFHHPESVVFDEQQKVYYVSNMAGKEEQDGFISKVSENGEILDTIWAKGLQDPKGLLLHGDKLFVTDISFLVEIDPASGDIISKTEVENAKSLNDIAADQEGNIYISDLVGNIIYKRDVSGNISEWLNTQELERPNGLLVSEDKIFVASWGKDEPGHLLQVDRKSKEIKKISPKGIGNLDGIQKIAPDSFYVSDWATGDIYRINTNGRMEKVLRSEKSSGDILFLKGTEELVLPMNHQNAIWWYRLN